VTEQFVEPVVLIEIDQTAVQFLQGVEVDLGVVRRLPSDVAYHLHLLADLVDGRQVSPRRSTHQDHQ